jgi:hypothetical protein
MPTYSLNASTQHPIQSRAKAGTLACHAVSKLSPKSAILQHLGFSILHYTQQNTSMFLSGQMEFGAVWQGKHIAYLGDKLFVEYALLTLSVHSLLPEATENVNSLASPATTFLSFKQLSRLGSTDCCCENSPVCSSSSPMSICVC